MPVQFLSQADHDQLNRYKPTLLFIMACDFLKQNKIIRIGTTRHAHINVYGRHHFNQEQVGKQQQL